MQNWRLVASRELTVIQTRFSLPRTFSTLVGWITVAMIHNQKLTTDSEYEPSISSLLIKKIPSEYWHIPLNYLLSYIHQTNRSLK